MKSLLIGMLLLTGVSVAHADEHTARLIAWDSSNGFSDLIIIGDDNSSPVETIRITGTPKGFRLSAEVLDSGAAEAFLRYWNSKGRIPVVLQDSQGHDLNKLVELRGVKPAADQVLSYCGRDPL